MNLEELEARLSAQREVLIVLMTAMMADGHHVRLFDELGQDAVLRDGEEDPGIVSTKAFGQAAHVADDIGRMLHAARKRAAQE